MKTESRTRQQGQQGRPSAGSRPGQAGRGTDAGLPPGWALQASPRSQRRAAAEAAPIAAASRAGAGRRQRPASAAGRGPAGDAPARGTASRSAPAAGSAPAARASAAGRAGTTTKPAAAPPARGPAPRTARPRLRPAASPGDRQLRPGAVRPGGGTTAAPAPARPAASPARLPGSRRLGGPRTPFVLLVLGLLGGGLICLLVINTTLAAASFQITHLQQSNTSLSQQQQALQDQIAKEQAPATIAHRAYQLGMRQQQHLTFLNARTGHIYRAPLTMAGVINLPPGYTP
jgi:hypothetical protein